MFVRFPFIHKCPLLGIAHKVATRVCHRGLSVAMLFLRIPKSISLSAILPQISLSLLFSYGHPKGVYLIATMCWDVIGIWGTCPIHFHLRYFHFFGDKFCSSNVQLNVQYSIWPKDVENSAQASVLENFKLKLIHFNVMNIGSNNTCSNV